MNLRLFYSIKEIIDFKLFIAFDCEWKREDVIPGELFVLSFDGIELGKIFSVEIAIIKNIYDIINNNFYENIKLFNKKFIHE